MKLYPRPEGHLAACEDFCGNVPYDLSNQRVTARVDGLAVERLSLSGAYDALLPGGSYGALDALPTASLYGLHADLPYRDPAAERIVIFSGHMVETRFRRGFHTYSALWFLGDDSPALYLKLTAKGDGPFLLRYHFGVNCAPEKLGVHTSGELALREREGDYAHYTVSDFARRIDGVYTAELTVAFDLGGEETPGPLPEAAARALFEAEEYWRELTVTAAAEQDAAFKAYCLNAAFSSYKRFGSFRGLFAGVAYAAPARTYYRDGYYTALALLPYRPAWVREEIVTLARGVGAHGECGSAVDAQGSPWWVDHADSPLFFALLVYAYVSRTGDHSLLNEPDVRGALVRVLDAAAANLDENGLLPRLPASRHDWADNVFREGYVTYVECLAYGALALCGRLLPDAARYASAAERLRAGINRLLWDDDLGWYVNFRTAEETEQNLSLDTVFAVLFDIAPEDRAKRMLANMERLLETQNSDFYGDIGVLCVYPPYRNAARLVEKSAYPLRYHNGAEWPYLSALYAFAKKLMGMDYAYPLRRWYEYSLERGFATPIEYFSPPYPPGGMLQAWSAFAAFVLDNDSADGVFR